MKLSVFAPQHRPDLVVISARAEGPGKILGDLRLELRQGATFLGWTFDEFKSMGSGNYDLEPKPGWKAGTDKVAPPEKSSRDNASPAA